ncbi:hypothetical protein GIB67_028005, partial [Kingdonia uniflora]
QEIPANIELSNLIIPSHRFTREEENKRSIKNLKITSTKTMLHTFFLKPFNLLSSLISHLSNQEVLPLSPSNPKRTPSTFFLTNYLQSLS